MAACARVKCAEKRARMAEACPGATDSSARPSESGAEETEDVSFAGVSFEARAVGRAAKDGSR
eukprot:1130962-Pleurochrysis_carterae.AAC.1